MKDNVILYKYSLFPVKVIEICKWLQKYFNGFSDAQIRKSKSSSKWTSSSLFPYFIYSYQTYHTEWEIFGDHREVHGL